MEKISVTKSESILPTINEIGERRKKIAQSVSTVCCSTKRFGLHKILDYFLGIFELKQV
jgi:hypothetical protein